VFSFCLLGQTNLYPSLTIINHHYPSLTIFNHHKPSLTIINTSSEESGRKNPIAESGNCLIPLTIAEVVSRHCKFTQNKLSSWSNKKGFTGKKKLGIQSQSIFNQYFCCIESLPAGTKSFILDQRTKSSTFHLGFRPQCQ
jgi:hypothetical protein